jgi:hypothetical protein
VVITSAPVSVEAPLAEMGLTVLTAANAAVNASDEALALEKLMGITPPLTVLIFVLSVYKDRIKPGPPDPPARS